jgi:protein SCO1/2
VHATFRPSSHAPNSTGPTEIGGPFSLLDQTGRPVTDRDFKGKPSLLFFGYTNCPDVCPTALAAIAADMKALGPDAGKVNFIFVTVDPARDTPKRLTEFLSTFDPRIHGLTGTPAQIAQIAREYNVYYHRIPEAGGGYMMDHSANTYLMDAHGHIAGVLSFMGTKDDATADLRRLIRR